MSPSHHLPKRIFPVPYQVDFTVELNGRHLDSTKRRLTWKVGFANPSAVFPHLFDANEVYIGDNSNHGSIAPYPDNPKKGVECRGREHEIILTWSILTGKAHIYVDSKEIIRHQPSEGSIFSTFSSSFHRGFDFPNPEFNGQHHIDIRCYARTPMGAKDMAVDDQGGKFRQYDLTVDGLSFFAMPAMFELGTDRMWNKVSRWGLTRAESSIREEESYHQGKGEQKRRHTVRTANDRDFGTTGRLEDEFHFEKAKRHTESNRHGHEISKTEYKAMSPRSESEEERMVRIAMEASLDDWDKDHGYGKTSHGLSSHHKGVEGWSHCHGSSEENNSASGNRPKYSRRTKKQPSGGNHLSDIGEDANLIDFGVGDAADAISQIDISRQKSSDVSVLGDDDATTASFMVNTAWNSGEAQRQPLPTVTAPQHQSFARQTYGNQKQPTPYHSTTFRANYAQQAWSSVGTLSTPTNSSRMPSSDASFAVPPPPTWADYNNAFGGAPTNMGASVIGGTTVTINPMSPASPGSVGLASPTSQQQPQQFGRQKQAQSRLLPQWQSQTQMFGVIGGGVEREGPPMGAPAAQVGNANKFDPMRSDPFAS